MDRKPPSIGKDMTLEQLLREYKERGGDRRLRPVLAGYEGYLRRLARRYARYSATLLHDENDLYAIAQQEVYFAALAYEFRCPDCLRECFLSLAGLRQHGRAAHRRLGLEPRTQMAAFVYYRVGRALQRVLNKERAESRSALRYDRRHTDRSDEDVLGIMEKLSSGTSPENDLIYILDALQAVVNDERALTSRDREIVFGLLEDQEGLEIARRIAVPHGLRETSARVIVSRTKEKLRGGGLLPRLTARTEKVIRA